MKKNDPKYYKVLLYLFNKKQEGVDSVHYYPLRSVIFDEEIINKYSHARRNKVIIDYMVCVYMGKLCRKDLCCAEYKTNKYQNQKGYSYFVGYYITPKGIEFLKEKKLI